jgi:hypothetical protein
VKRWFVLAILAGALLPANAGIIGRDDRVPVATLVTSGESADRALAAAAGAVGLLQCDNGRMASAVLVGERRIATSAHVFIDVLPAVRAARVRCRFASPASGAPVDVDLSSIRLGIERPVTGHNICSNSRDWAVLSLSAAPQGMRPIAIAGPFPVGTEAAIVTAVARGGPTVGKCTIRDLALCQQTGASLIFTDCDAEPGSSGGATLVNVSGRWMLGGVTRGASPQGAAAYDRSTAYHMAVPVRGPLASAIGAGR